MAEEEGNSRPIIQIDLDDQKFVDFVRQWDKYREQVAQQPGEWNKVGGSIKQAGGAFEGLAAGFHNVLDVARDPHLTNVFSLFAKVSQATAKSWDNVSKSIKASGKFITTFERSVLKVGAGFAKFGALGFGVAAAAAGATTKAASDLSEQNRENRGFDLKPGESQAFQDTYGEALGVDKSYLERFAQIKQNPAEWTKLAQMTAGKITVDDIDRESPAQLAIDSLHAAAQAKQQLGGAWAEFSGANSMFGFGPLNNASKRPESFWQDTFDKYSKERDRLALDQGKYDQGTEFMQHQKANFEELTAAFNNATITLAPALNKLSDKFTDLVTKLLNKGAPQVEEVAEAVMSDKPVPRPAEGEKYPHTLLGGLSKIGYGLRDWWGNVSKVGSIQKGADAPKFHWDMAHPFGRLEHKETEETVPMDDARSVTPGKFEAAEKQFNLTPGLLGIARKIESHNNDHAENPDSHALGSFQLMPSMIKKLNVDPFDANAASFAAGRIMREQLDRFGGNLAKGIAGYGGDTHIAEDTQKFNGEWLKGAKDATIDYLRRYQKEGVDLGLSDNEQSYLDSRMKKIEAEKAIRKAGQRAEPADVQDGKTARMDVDVSKTPAVNSVRVQFQMPPGMNAAVQGAMLAF
jgi:hypothetical protein